MPFVEHWTHYSGQLSSGASQGNIASSDPKDLSIDKVSGTPLTISAIDSRPHLIFLARQASHATFCLRLLASCWRVESGIAINGVDEGNNKMLLIFSPKSVKRISAPSGAVSLMPARVFRRKRLSPFPGGAYLSLAHSSHGT